MAAAKSTPPAIDDGHRYLSCTAILFASARRGGPLCLGLLLVSFGLGRPLAGGPDFGGDGGEHTVDEPSGFLSRETVRQLDGLGNDRPHRHVGPLEELVGRQPEEAPVDDRHPVQRPADGEAGNQVVDAFPVPVDPNHQVGDERLGLDGQLLEQGGRREVLGVGLVQQGKRPFPRLPPTPDQG